MIFWERDVIFRNCLSNLINDAYCLGFFFFPESIFPNTSYLSLELSSSQGPMRILYLRGKRWLLSSIQISAQWPQIVETSTMSNSIPPLFPNPIFLMSKDKLLHLENGNRWRDLTLAAFLIPKNPAKKWHQRSH